MSNNDFGWGYIFGRDAGKQEERSKANNQTGGGGGGDAILMLLPYIEAIFIGLVLFMYTSTDKGINYHGLHWHPIAGLAAALTLPLCYLFLFTIPIIGSILNVAVSSLWATFIIEGTDDFVWGVVVFLVSLGMHSLLDEMGESKKHKITERIILFLLSVVALGLLYTNDPKDTTNNQQKRQQTQSKNKLNLKTQSKAPSEFSIVIGNREKCEKKIIFGKNTTRNQWESEVSKCEDKASEASPRLSCEKKASKALQNALISQEQWQKEMLNCKAYKL